MSQTLTARIGTGIADLPAGDWDALTDGGNPFTCHAFLAAMETSRSVDRLGDKGRTGWQSAPILIDGPDGHLAGALPAYIKTHSLGEYVFDHAWADAWQRAGGDYYPKLQIAVPFTPATGPRILTRLPELALPLLRAAETLCQQADLSSAHATFIEPEQVPIFEEAGWLIRHDIQFHWENRGTQNQGYANFDDFLAQLSSAKRKNLRKERAAAQEGVEIRQLTGDQIRPEHWDAFWHFYQDTGSRKWGQPYLTRRAFTQLGETMADRIILVMAFIDDQPIAGALNFIGADALYGRYWGALVEKPFLHFELCYYQAIDAAIARGLSRVEAGAQGGHKLARGYEPVRTVSAHYIPHTGFRAAIADFLRREREGIASDQILLDERTPFRR